ncbi:MAG: HAD family phosphatase [Treponema sp.]|nr:HAD family phosphatase [Candidatus Treponema equifaecale]
MEKIKAVLFDMDGVLLDTESVCKITWQRAAQEYGIKNIEEIFIKCVGCNRHDTELILKDCFPQNVNPTEFRNRTSELFYVVEAEQGLALKPFVVECLTKLKNEGYRIALASSTRAENVHRQLKAAGIFDFFETLTTGDMVEHSKPAPDIYLKAAASLNLPPENCVAIEDSPNGVRAAVAAGIKCIMVPDLIQPDEEMKAKSWKIFSNLGEVLLDA